MQLGAGRQDDEPSPQPAEDLEGLVVRRHQEAAEVVLAKLDNPNALMAENLQHLAWALDHIQATTEGLGNSANISNQMIRVLHELGVADSGDVWDDLVEEITRGNAS